jgi:2-oxoisovalerate dehydrogenase E1 component beta subunit
VSTGGITYLEAIRLAMRDAMRDDDRVFLMGEDVGHFGGPFGVTQGLFDEFGPTRVIDTPISEEGFVGAAFGAAWQGERPIAELQFADFVSCPFDQIVTVGAKTHWRNGIAMPVVIRLPSGGGVRGGPFHASSPEGWFVGVAGLKVVCPGTVDDAYGLLRSAIEDDDPVLYFEHKALYRRLRAPEPPPEHRVPLGRARVMRRGTDVSVITYGSGVTLALEVAERVAERMSVEVVDLRTIWPIDAECVLDSVGRTSRALVLQEAAGSIGAANTVVSLISRRAFESLDAPIAVCAPPDTPVPYAPQLEDAYLPDAARVESALEDLVGY